MEETEFEKLDKQVPFLFFSTIVTSERITLPWRHLKQRSFVFRKSRDERCKSF